MSMQSAINLGGKNTMTPEHKISLMLENNKNVFILRWKKEAEFQTSYFGFEILGFVQKRDKARMETTHVPVFSKGELKFHPDEHNVPVAYCADTPNNRKILALSFYCAHYMIAGLITPTGTINREEIQAEIEKMANELGIKKPIRTKVVGVYGTSVPTEKPKVEITPETKADPAKSVFGSKEKMDEAMPKPTPVKKLTKDECDVEAEKNVISRFEPFVAKLQVEKGNYWKMSKDYKGIIVPEIQKETLRLYEINEIKVEMNAPSSPELEKAPTEQK